VVETKLDLGNGQKITDGDLLATEAEQNNHIANQYYNQSIGYDWKAQLYFLARKLFVKQLLLNA